MPTPPLPLLQGSLDLLVLGALSSGATHGYGVATLVRERSAGALEIEDAALYQALHRLERRGLVAAEWGLSDNNRRAPSIADDGWEEAAARGRREVAPIRASRRRCHREGIGREIPGFGHETARVPIVEPSPRAAVLVSTSAARRTPGRSGRGASRHLEMRIEEPWRRECRLMRRVVRRFGSSVIWSTRGATAAIRTSARRQGCAGTS